MKVLFAVVLLCNGAMWSEQGVIYGSDLRAIFHQQDITEEQLEEIVSYNIAAEDMLSMAYQGICQTMLAEHAFLPTAKLDCFNKGKQAIETAIATDNSNPELRYIRLMVQLNAPWFLGYSNNISEDLDSFLNGPKSNEIPDFWKKKFIENLLLCKHLLPEQKSKLENVISANANLG